MAIRQHMDATAKIIKTQFPDINGFHLTVPGRFIPAWKTPTNFTTIIVTGAFPGQKMVISFCVTVYSTGHSARASRATAPKSLQEYRLYKHNRYLVGIITCMHVYLLCRLVATGLET